MKSEREHVYFLDTPAGRKLDSTYEANEKAKTMNDTIHYDEKGGWETDSYRAKKLLMIKARGPHSEYLTQAVLKEAIKSTHFLDTPAGRKWENIVAWKKAQKESKTNK